VRVFNLSMQQGRRVHFQVRWGQLYRIPRTSVLGHMLIVAILSYLFSLEIGACAKRSANNYFTALFHDLPEIRTKDIISPVKRAATGLDRFVKDFEQEEMEPRIYAPALIPKAWQPEMRMFTEDEFVSKVTIDGQVRHTTSDTITESYNQTYTIRSTESSSKLPTTLRRSCKRIRRCRTVSLIHHCRPPFKRRNYPIAKRRLQA
jgi:hypothetical protein